LPTACAAGAVGLDVLVHNRRGIDFWRSIGFHGYSVIMRLPRPA
jgi:ribosomal protein S18 acetylase RimI-like enzyme